MNVQIADIYYRVPFNDHWLITGIKAFGNEVYQFEIYNLDKGSDDTYVSPFGRMLPQDAFILIA